MKVRFCPMSIYYNRNLIGNHRSYIEREMDFLPPQNIKIRDVSNAGIDSFWSLLEEYDYEVIIKMAEYCSFEDFGCFSKLSNQMETMTKQEFLEELYDDAYGYDWKINKMFYDINVNAYYCIVELDI